MADRLYLSLWYPNFRLESLPSAITGVLRQFALVGGKRVAAASAYPIDFTEAPVYQRIYVQSDFNSTNALPEVDPAAGESDGVIEAAIAEATEQLHDDMAYEFEMRWQLWALEDPAPAFGNTLRHIELDTDELSDGADPDESLAVHQDSPWKLRPHHVRIVGFGPQFDMAGYEQSGHVLIDFGLDAPWILDAPIDVANQGSETKRNDEDAQAYIRQNIEKLLAFTLLVEKNCGISSRLLWTESGEPLAEKLIARLQRVN